MEVGNSTSAENLWLVGFRVGDHECALPLRTVDRVVPMVDILPVPPVAPVVIGLINVHGRPVPVFDLLRSLRRGTVVYGPSAFLLIGHTMRRPFAVAANAVDGAVRVSEARVASMVELVPGAGMLPAVLSGDRGLVFIHDPETLLTLEQELELDSTLQAGA